jgi:hypothetical protein
MTKRLFLLFALLLFQGTELLAQCAMCRATVESNISNGRGAVGIGLNTGILYMLSLPYIMFAIIGYFWYKQSRKNQRLSHQMQGIQERARRALGQ